MVAPSPIDREYLRAASYLKRPSNEPTINDYVRPAVVTRLANSLARVPRVRKHMFDEPLTKRRQFAPIEAKVAREISGIVGPTPALRLGSMVGCKSDSLRLRR
jgi:hypothetical protein